MPNKIITYRSNSKNRIDVHTIFDCINDSPNSYAGYLLLKNELLHQDVNFILNEKRKQTLATRRSYKDRMAWLEFRTTFLNKIISDQGELYCQYCGKKHLDPETKILNKLATIDHILPLSKGGSRYELNNLAVACYPCNIKKGNDKNIKPSISFIN